MLNHRLPVRCGEQRAWTSLTTEKRFDGGGGGGSSAGGEIAGSSCTYTSTLPIVAAAEFSCRYPADTSAAQSAIAVAVIVLDDFVVACCPLSNPGAYEVKDGPLRIPLI